MAILEDYYRILQVHYLAEPEVIESAYKRLAKKYHPDVSKTLGAEFRMKKLNEAYATLSDSEKRKAYDAQRRLRPEPPPRPAAYARPAPEGAASYETPEPPPDPDTLCPAQAKDALARYFSCLKERDYPGAYGLITATDKKNITPEDFAKWQSGVSRIYVLQEYAFKADSISADQTLSGQTYPQVIDFSVNTVEQNAVMDRLEKDTVSKKAVLEDSIWRIYIGYDDIRPHIARFEELSGLLAAKSAINDLVDFYSFKDSGTGLYNKKGFAEAAQREIIRYNRYGNIFSVILLEVSLDREFRRAGSQELLRHIADWAGRLLGDSFKELDLLGRWGETGFIVLLPETNLSGCLNAAQSITEIFSKEAFVHNKKTYTAKLNIGVEEFRGSMEETLRKLGDYIRRAAKFKGNTVVYKNGLIH
ncbi:diguanylate cyclase (GGDEF) domain-containing protein [Sporobacter termitidis DSM 10068]|uniref:Diguanylate cyclase (GGDEF) domain-containing protein n=1 Tax=Sporobacter termitidis DSM 10068 TaxID=1123282 RepID=A0A1M5UV51_9FIRM|nr:DnaJ domain-containing protein [Sporobacter termitidis]SHH66887.1 diguanylate cyclase (GGDEF) domain-containing protein [Sporobacter termitidis DSM 10068]